MFRVKQRKTVYVILRIKDYCGVVIIQQSYIIESFNLNPDCTMWIHIPNTLIILGASLSLRSSTGYHILNITPNDINTIDDRISPITNIRCHLHCIVVLNSYVKNTQLIIV